MYLVAIIIALVVLSVLLLPVILLNPKTKKKTISRATQFEIDSCVVRFNGYINEYNCVGTMIRTKMSEILKQAQQMSDTESMEALMNIVTNFQKIEQELSVNIIRTKSMFGDIHADLQMIETNLTAIKDMIYDMKDLYHSLDYIEPKQKVELEYVRSNNVSLDFFHGCKTYEEITKRYRLLSKAFHPDSGCGNSELFQKLKEEYDNVTIQE